MHSSREYHWPWACSLIEGSCVSVAWESNSLFAKAAARRYPNCSPPIPAPAALNEEAGKLLLEGFEDFAKKARLMTSIHAKKPSVLTAAGGANAVNADGTAASDGKPGSAASGSASAGAGSAAAAKSSKAIASKLAEKKKSLKRL